MRKKWLTMMKAVRQLSIALLVLGGVFSVNNYPGQFTLILIGGIGFSIYTFLRAFEKTIPEPNWELVYPELALGHSDVIELTDKD